MVPVEKITKERLDRWAKRCGQAHATPLLLVSVGHDHVEGQLVICTVEDEVMDIPTIRRMLLTAIEML